MPILGFIDAGEERMRRTVDAIERELAHDGLVQRWTGAGDEGAFVICSYWLVECLRRVRSSVRAPSLST